MDIGTAKPAPAARRGVIHHGLDLVDPDAAFSVADFAAHVDGVLADLAARGAWHSSSAAPASGFAPSPAGCPSTTSPGTPRFARRWRPRSRGTDLASLVVRLRAIAPALAATTDLRNPRRVVRALEIATLRGDGPLPSPRGYPGPLLRIGLDVGDHAVHRAWIERRAEAQLDGGILPEAAGLRARFDPSLPAFSAIGYREAWDLLDGRLDRAGYLAVNVRRNVAFARRQRTWFRREPVDLALDASDPASMPRAVAAALALIGR